MTHHTRRCNSYIKINISSFRDLIDEVFTSSNSGTTWNKSFFVSRISKCSDFYTFTSPMRKCYSWSYKLVCMFRIDTKLEMYFNSRIELHIVRFLEKLNSFFYIVRFFCIDKFRCFFVFFAVWHNNMFKKYWYEPSFRGPNRPEDYREF